MQGRRRNTAYTVLRGVFYGEIAQHFARTRKCHEPVKDLLFVFLVGIDRVKNNDPTQSNRNATTSLFQTSMLEIAPILTERRPPIIRVNEGD